MASEHANDSEKIENIDWIGCKSFTIEEGKRQIQLYMDTWRIPSPWLCNFEFIREEQLEYKTRYMYRAEWSIPTQSEPIPRATASVDFFIHVPRISPDERPVDVHFIVESNLSRCVPGHTQFREKWLMDVIESKTLLTSAYDF